MTKVVIFHKDVLVKFSYEIIEYLCQINNVEIESINNTEYKQDQKLTDDLIQIITIFANKLYGQRSQKTKMLISEIKSIIDSKERN